MPADRVIDQIGPSDRSVCIGGYDEVKDHSPRETVNCLFGIDQPTHSADFNLWKKYWPPV